MGTWSGFGVQRFTIRFLDVVLATTSMSIRRLSSQGSKAPLAKCRPAADRVSARAGRAHVPMATPARPAGTHKLQRLCARSGLRRLCGEPRWRAKFENINNSSRHPKKKLVCASCDGGGVQDIFEPALARASFGSSTDSLSCFSNSKLCASARSQVAKRRAALRDVVRDRGAWELEIIDRSDGAASSSDAATPAAKVNADLALAEKRTNEVVTLSVAVTDLDTCCAKRPKN